MASLIRPMSPLKIVTTATIGTLLEWAEYTFFAYMAVQLSTHFFPMTDPSLARIKTYGIFAASYLMRPIGACFFGILGDTIGRKPALMSSMLLMGLATMLIGCLPTYAEIGSYAAVLLIICRLLQGFAVSGEFHGAITYLHEHATARPYLMGSFAPFAAALGMSLGAYVALLTSLPGVPHYAWRIPFLGSGLLCALAIYLRQSLNETPLFQQIQQEAKMSQLLNKRISILRTFKSNKQGMIQMFSMGLFTSIYVYIGNVFFKGVCIQFGMASEVASQMVTIGQIVAAFFILFFGFIADKAGGRRVCLTGLFLAIFAGPFILYCAQSGDPRLTLGGQIVYGFVNGFVFGPMMTILMNNFKVQNRYSSSAIGWSLAVALFGGTALLVAETLTKYTGSALGAGCYISLAAIAALTTLCRNPVSAEDKI
jgi:MHS family proline/betaine transporter-like MFS transporter